MSGFAENCGMHGFAENSIRKTIFDPRVVGKIPRNNEGWTVERLDWANPDLQARRRKLTPCKGPRIVQGRGRVSGHLIGGCSESLEMLKASDWWPPPTIWDGSIFFYETSEEGPPPAQLLRWLRNFGVQGLLSRISAFVFGRPGGQISVASHMEYERVILQALAEFGATEIPVMVDMDFGHTDPIMTLPYGAMAEIDCERSAFSILESAVI